MKVCTFEPWLVLAVLLPYGFAFPSPKWRHMTPHLGPHVIISHHKPPTTSSSSLTSTGDDENNYAFHMGGGSWKLTNDFPQFLNQISLQSLMVILISLGDIQTIRWMDNFTQPIIPSGRERTSVRLTGTTVATNAITSDQNVANPNGKGGSRLLVYHGLGAFNATLFPTWEAYFAALLEQPQEVFVIQSAVGSLQVKDYELEINPASLCSRLISVREQIAEEMANDLQVVANMGYHTLDSYWDYMDNQLDEEEEEDQERKGGDSTTTPKRQYTEIGASDSTTTPNDDDNFGPTFGDGGAGTENKPDEVTMSSGDARPRRLAPHNLVFLDYSLDRVGDRRPSTLRKGNFDLVVLLATQESIHRVLNNQLSSSAAEEVGPDFAIYQKYLLDFYAERLVSHFVGIQRYGRADDFLEELLFSSPRVSTEGGFAALVDPVKVAELILRERRQVALEWSAMSKDIPNDHIVIKRLQLDALMQSYQ